MIRRLPAAVLATAAVLLMPTLVAAAEPALTATVIPGQEIDLVGSGFPADADVALAIQRNGTDAGSQALKTDATGGFTATIDAGPGRGGVYTMTATSGSATATVQALAVETAGGLQSTPPPTDTVTSAPARHEPANAGGAMAMLVIVGACAAGLAISAVRGGPVASVNPSDPR